MLNTLNLLFFNSSVDESRSISDKFLMNLSRSQGLFILVFYLLLDKTVSSISFLFLTISSTRNIWFSFTILLYYLKNVQVRKEFKNVYMRWKTKDKTYGIQKPTQHFVRGIFTLFTSLCLTRPLFLKWDIPYSLIRALLRFLTTFSKDQFMVCHIFTPSHFSATLLSDPTSTLLGIQHFSISLNKHPRSKKRPPPSKCPPSGAPSKPPLPPSRLLLYFLNW